MKRLLLLCAAMLSAVPCVAGEIVQKQGPGTLEVRFDGPTPTIALADLITVTLTVEGRKGLRVRAPDRNLPFDFPWMLVELSKPSRTPLDSDREAWRLVYRLAPRAPGRKVELKFPDVQIRENDAEDQVLRWDPILFEVGTTIGDPERGALRDITGIETTPTPTPVETWEWLWPLLGCALVLIVPVVLGVRRALRRQTRRSPAQLALHEWQRLTDLGLPEQGRSERFITLLTLLVRQYLERQFALPARRQTTPEFLAVLANHAVLTAEEKQFLTRFLQQSEAIKFGQAALSVDECRQWAEATRQFLLSRAMRPTS